MKRISTVVLVIVLALLTAALLPAQVFADSLSEYVSEVKIGMGKDAGEAKAALDGYTILSDDKGNPVDLNQGAGGGWGSKGDKIVYLGYKTTTDEKDAITDLALMNMKGGYSVKDYEYLMETQMEAQIIPFVDNILASINEYRENCNSLNSENKARAQFFRNVLNKFTDDDCGGAGLGDLLLNETVYEIAKPKYDALSEAEQEKTSLYEINLQVRDSLPEGEKDKHADILTIVAQSNGKIMLMIENLLTRAADTGDSTWLDRFTGITYEDLVEHTGGTPTDSARELARLYDDDANVILSMWETFQEKLLDYDKNLETVAKYDLEKAESVNKSVEDIGDNTSDEKAADALIDYAKLQIDNLDFINSAQSVAVHDILSEIDYLDGTLLDFFSMSREEIEDDITVLYPLVASLTDGQKAALEYLTLTDLFAVALTSAESYSEIDLAIIDETSVFADVDRSIYQKGGVALTSDALRTDALAKAGGDDDSMFSASTVALMTVTGVTAFGALVSFGGYVAVKLDVYALQRGARLVGPESGATAKEAASLICSRPGIVKALQNAHKNGEEFSTAVNRYAENYAKNMAPKSATFGKLAVGFTVAMIILAAVTTYLSWKDMQAYYKVDFTPAPRYIIDEKDLIGYNSRGEKIILKNQSAYYKAVDCNRKADAEYYGVLGTCADMNGDVGKQWLVLYAVKKEAMNPILASSLMAVVNSKDIPAGYTSGIHMFGSKAAFNLNSGLYDWNQSAKSVFVYFKTDDTVAKTAGSNFTGGTLAVAGGAGLAIGALATALGVSSKRKNGFEAAA